jgi:hypothetical protein
VLRRFADNYGPAPLVASEGVAETLLGFAALARASQTPVVVVIFPDRLLVDRELRERLGLADLDERVDLATLRRFVAEHAAGLPVVDATDALRGGSENYRPSDTHLSDVGNVVAGRYVGERLAELIGAHR